MTREDLKKIMPILQAYADGKAIQVKSSDDWVDVESFSFRDLMEYSFRVKPEIRQFKNIDELINTWNKINPHHFPDYTKPLIWIENRFTEEVELIIGFNYANGFHDDDRVRTVSRELTMDDLYREYRFLNGDICGVKENDI